MMSAIEQQSLAANERQLASQDAFHGKTEAAYARLASSVERSLKESVAESARAAGAALQPVMQTTMAGIARETASLHDAVTQAVTRQLDGFTSRFETSTTAVADIWNQALAGHQRASEALAGHLRGSLDQFAASFETRSAGLLEGVSTRLEATAGGLSDAWREALAQHERAGETLAEQNRHALASAAAAFEQHGAALARTVGQSHADLHADLAARDDERLAAWRETLEAMAASLNDAWQQTGAQTASRQQEICDTLARTARDISEETRSHASGTIAEISRLLEAASEAPKAAAEVIAELRQKLTDSMERDTAMLDERKRLLETLDTLLGAVNHASTEQRTAVDALVTTSADLLARVGERFSGTVEAGTGKLDAVAAQVTSGAVEVASLSEALGAAVQLFGASNDKLVAHLQRIEGALDKSLARSDEQLAYYVAQAREVIDLSMMSQKQIVEDLRQLARQRASAGAEAA
jgi:hypothetical protein